MRGWHGTMNRVSSEHVISKPLAHKLHLHHVRYWTGLFLVVVFFSLKKTYSNTSASKVELKVFQYRFVQSCHPFVRIQMVEHSSPWTVRYSSGFGNPRSALVSRLLPFSTVRLKALWSVCGHRCRRHSGSGFWKCVAHRSFTLCVRSGVSDLQFRRKLRDCESLRTHSVRLKTSLQPGHI